MTNGSSTNGSSTNSKHYRSEHSRVSTRKHSSTVVNNSVTIAGIGSKDSKSRMVSDSKISSSSRDSSTLERRRERHGK